MVSSDYSDAEKLEQINQIKHESFTESELSDLSMVERIVS